MKVCVQLYTGAAGAPSPLWDERSLRRKIERLRAGADVDRAVIGWLDGADERYRIIDWLRAEGLQVYLWFPVFSELDAYAAFTPLISRDGQPVMGGALTGQGERFSFCCPGDPENVRKVLRVFDERYARLPIDGVFLDRIRYPSFDGGLAAFYSCYCAACGAPDAPMPTPGGANPLGIAEYAAGRYSLNDPDTWLLLLRKAERVTGALTVVCGHLRERGLSIGMDMFAPFLAPFVGQDYPALCALADFVKPMFYRATYAPAGLPHEIDKYAEAFGGSAEEVRARREALRCVAGIDAAEGGIGDAFLAREVKAASALANGRAQVFAGVEAVRMHGVCEADAAYVRRSAAVCRAAGADGIALSWDLNATPEEWLSGV